MNYDYIAEYKRWCDNTKDNREIYAELMNMDDQDELIRERFHSDLTFGTAGLRGAIGAGTNAMNVYTVRKATQGYSSYLKTLCPAPSVAISYDSRINSKLFAREAAKVFAGNGIRVFLFDEIRPTPVLSYAVRYLKCTGGVMITASHNPSFYNGYKAYNSDGAQLTVEAASETTKYIDKIDIFNDIEMYDFEYAMNEKFIEYIDENLMKSYYGAVENESFHSDVNGMGARIKVAFTPLNGTGYEPVLKVLKRVGINDVSVVMEQAIPDGNFPTCPYPNPEFKEALELGIKLGQDVGADLLIATDPDADRLGAVIFHDGKYTQLSGNEVGVLLFFYIVTMRTTFGKMPADAVAVRSIVSSPLIDALAKDHNVKVHTVLTGFKNIAEYIKELELENKEKNYIFGYEEACGYLPGTYVRDKDAVASSMLLCEMAAFYKSNGKTLIDVLNEIYETYGFHYHPTLNYVFDGINGASKIETIMNTLRNNMPEEIGGIKITGTLDYLTGMRNECGISKTEKLPVSNMIVIHLEDGSSIIARPSGTEPKIKFYFSIVKDRKAAAETKEILQKDLEKKLSLVK